MCSTNAEAQKTRPAPKTVVEMADLAASVRAPCLSADWSWWTSTDPSLSREAARMCHETCRVMLACRLFAWQTSQRGGVWGGLTQHEWEAKRDEVEIDCEASGHEV